MQTNGCGVSAYDELLRAVAASSRSAVARDRTKSAAELAADEAARLAELEALRLQRMRGDDAGGALAAAGGDRATAAKPPGLLSGDDLGVDTTSHGLTYRQRRRQASGVSILEYAKKPGDDAAGNRMAEGDGDEAEEEDEEEDDDDDDEEEVLQSSSDDDASSSGRGANGDCVIRAHGEAHGIRAVANSQCAFGIRNWIWHGCNLYL